MDINYQFLEQTFYLVLAAVPTTLNLTVTSLLLSLPLAFFMALVRLRRTRYVSGFVGAYITLLRGTPIVLQILLIYSLLPSLLHALVGTLGWTINVFDWNPILYAYLVFTLNTTALLAEVFRSALGSIERGQMEAALCAGLTKVQAYVHILIPQALVTALPNICNVTVNLIEDKRRAGQTQERDNNGARELDVFVADIMGDGPRSKAIRQAFGLQRRGY